jgi:hypothetical protein
MAFGTSYDTIPKTVHAYVCMQPPPNPGDYPWDCQYMEVESAALNPVDSGLTKEQYDQLFGAVIAIVVMIIIIGLIKKAIEQ